MDIGDVYNAASRRGLLQAQEEEVAKDKTVRDHVLDSKVILMGTQCCLKQQASAITAVLGIDAPLLDTVRQLWKAYLLWWIEQGWGGSEEYPALVSIPSYNLVQQKTDRKINFKKPGPGVISLMITLALCKIGCHILRLPLTTAELLLLLRTIHIPYFHMIPALDSNTLASMEERDLPTSIFCPTLAYDRPTLNQLVLHLGIILTQSPTVVRLPCLAVCSNGPLVAYRMAKTMDLPAGIVTCAVRLTEAYIAKRCRKEGIATPQSTTQPKYFAEDMILGCVVYTMMLLYGLDDVEEDAESWDASSIVQELKLPSFDAWMMNTLKKKEEVYGPHVDRVFSRHTMAQALSQGHEEVDALYQSLLRLCQSKDPYRLIPPTKHSSVQELCRLFHPDVPSSPSPSVKLDVGPRASVRTPNPKKRLPWIRFRLLGLDPLVTLPLDLQFVLSRAQRRCGGNREAMLSHVRQLDRFLHS